MDILRKIIYMGTVMPAAERVPGEIAHVAVTEERNACVVWYGYVARHNAIDWQPAPQEPLYWHRLATEVESPRDRAIERAVGDCGRLCEHRYKQRKSKK